MKKDSVIMIRSWTKRNSVYDSIFLILFLFAITFIILSKSPLHFWINSDSETDSSVFKTIAMIIDKGYVPYRDSFDHKGPLVYFLNYLGMHIARYRGTWLIEFAAVFFTFYFMYQIGCLCCRNLHAAVALLFTSAPLFTFYESGNKVEEFAMPFIALSLYYFLDYLMNSRISVYRLILCGVSLGAVCLLRANMISVWIVFCVSIAVILCRQKKISELIRFILYFLGGFLVFVLPFIFWLAYHNAIGAFWEQYIIFNAKYCGHASLSQIWITYFFSLEHKTVLFALLVDVCLFVRQRNRLFGIYTLYMIVSFLMLSLSGRTYLHYNIVTVPALIFPITALYGLCEQQWKNAAGQTGILLLTVCLLTGTLHADWLPPVQDLAKIYQERHEEHFSEQLRNVCRLIDEKTDASDKISVYGNWDLVYVMSDRMHATHYSYQAPIGTIDPEIKERYFDELENEKPKIIVSRKCDMDDRMEHFLDDHDYCLLWLEDVSWGNGEESAVVYIRQ